MNKTATYRPKQSYYSAAGQKLMTEVSTDPALGGSIVAEKTRIYLSAMVLKGGEIEFLGTAEGRALSIESLHKNPDGEVSYPNYIDASSNQFRYEYQLKDHLGNLRVACRCGDPLRNENTGKVRQNASNREPIRIVQQNDYDAWGLDFGNHVSSSGVEDRFQYNSKERIQDLGIELYDYGARHYDAAVGRWSLVDPLADHPNQVDKSTYAAMFNNPLRFIDPDGRSAKDIINLEKATGQVTVTKAKGNDEIRLLSEKGKIEKSVDYGENGSFLKENKIFKSKNSTAIVSFNSEGAEKLYNIAAESDKEFLKIDGKNSGGVNVSIITTTHEEATISNANIMVTALSKKGFIGTKQSHTHPAGTVVPSGHYGLAEGNPNSMMPYKRSGDVGNALFVSDLPGFHKIKFELIPRGKNVKTIYDGVNQARVVKK